MVWARRPPGRAVGHTGHGLRQGQQPHYSAGDKVLRRGCHEQGQPTPSQLAYPSVTRCARIRILVIAFRCRLAALLTSPSRATDQTAIRFGKEPERTLSNPEMKTPREAKNPGRVPEPRKAPASPTGTEYSFDDRLFFHEAQQTRSKAAQEQIVHQSASNNLVYISQQAHLLQLRTSFRERVGGTPMGQAATVLLGDRDGQRREFEFSPGCTGSTMTLDRAVPGICSPATLSLNDARKWGRWVYRKYTKTCSTFRCTFKGPVDTFRLLSRG